MISHRTKKIVLYSHDTQGLGHMRRNLAIASALINANPNLAILLITGAGEINSFDIPPGIDCLTLPALGKQADGQYRPRSLSVSLRHLINLRASAIRAAIEAFAPDAFIVDKLPLGAFDELKPALEWLRSRPRTRCILGLREILDEPETARREWQAAGSDAAIRAYFDAIWVYGDPRVCNPITEYGLPDDIAAKVQFTGYLNRYALCPPTQAAADPLLARLNLGDHSLALCMVGGGQDGEQLADAFLQAELPANTCGLVITGPYLPAAAMQRLQARAAASPHKFVLPFVAHPEIFLQRANSVITMGGYNSVCETVSFNKPALIVPRVKPRLEQLIRAKRLARLNVVSTLHPADLTPAALSGWLARQATAAPRAAHNLDLDGLRRIPTLLTDLLAAPPKRAVNRTTNQKFLSTSHRWLYTQRESLPTAKEMFNYAYH
ncbi:MAG: glycosyltransferase family protein [Anaerolineae bacterium]